MKIQIWIKIQCRYRVLKSDIKIMNKFCWHLFLFHCGCRGDIYLISKLTFSNYIYPFYPLVTSETFFYSWIHDDVINLKLFFGLLTLCEGNPRSPVNSPNKGQWRGALIFLWSAPWINGWVINREAGDLRRHQARYDVIVMHCVQMYRFLKQLYIHFKVQVQISGSVILRET